MLLPDPQRPLIVRSPDGNCRSHDKVTGMGVLAGSFNPLHRGHLALQKEAERVLGRDVCFEISIENADKATIPTSELTARIAQFSGNTLALTCAPRFVDKAELFPGCCFVVGFDTAVRLLDVRFYGGDSGLLRDAFGRITVQGCRFLVAGRLQKQAGADGFAQLHDLVIPDEFSDLFTGLSENEFREDISSTQLRDGST